MPRFENTWNWSNVIALIVIAVGGLGAFFSVQSKTQHLDEEVKSVKQQIHDVKTQTAYEQAKSEARIMQYLQDIRGDVKEIRAAQMRKEK